MPTKKETPIMTPDTMLDLLFAAIAQKVQESARPEDLATVSKFRGLLVRSMRQVADQIEPYSDSDKASVKASSGPPRIGFTGW